MKKKIKDNKAITLVALVITIIILLILAGVSIATLTESGLFNKAKESKQKSENAQIKEETTLADYENKIDSYIGSGRDYKLTYSTEEQAVGTYLNNKTIFQKTYPNLSIQTGTNVIIGLEDLPNIDKIIDISGQLGDGEEQFMLNSFYSSSCNILVWYDSREGNGIKCKSTGWSGTADVTIRYTKK